MGKQASTISHEESEKEYNGALTYQEKERKKEKKRKRGRITSVDENVEKLEHSYTAGRNVKWCSHC